MSRALTNALRLGRVIQADGYFGITGDGVTDDRAGFVAALSEAVDRGCALVIPSGFRVSLGSSVPLDYTGSPTPVTVTLLGGGGRSTILWRGGSAEENLFALSGPINFRASGVTFDANRQNQSDTTGYYGTIGGAIDDGSRVVLDRCEFLNGRIADIYLTGPTGSGEYAEVEITRCRFSDGLVGDAVRAAQAVSVSEGIRLRCNHNTFVQPTLPATYGRGGVIMQRPGGSAATAWGQFEAIGNVFENFGRQTADRLGCLYIYSGSEATTITGNRFRNSVGTAITVKSDCGSTSVVGNVVNGHADAAVAAISFFDQADTYTSSTGRALVISGNAVYNPEYQSIYVDGARNGLADFKNAIVSSNVCDGGLRGIHFRNIENLKIHGNTVNNTTGIGIFGEDCSGDIDIRGNTLATGAVGLDINGTTSGARVSVDGNTISDLSATAVRLRSPVECFHISGNRIAGCTTAFDTRGATEFSSITENASRGDTTAWDKSGAYGALLWRNNAMESAVPFATRTITIASGAATVFADFHYVDTEGGAATDDLVTLNGGYEGREVVLFAANNARDVVLKDGTGNMALAGDFTMNNSQDSIRLLFRLGTWVELGRSDNAA